MKKGKFIVLDGVDGSGKATQTELLRKHLQKEGRIVKKIDFPRYDTNFFGKLVGECLTGKYGSFGQIDPHIASVLYAADRWESGKTIENWLNAGCIVIADRYVSSNQIHQGGKIRDDKERIKFLRWLDAMEHGTFGIPRPDLLIYLHLPIKLSLELLSLKSLAKKKRYLEGKKDVHENDIQHLENSRESALKLVRENSKWAQIECSRDGKILSKAEIHAKIFAEIEKFLK